MGQPEAASVAPTVIPNGLALRVCGRQTRPQQTAQILFFTHLFASATKQPNATPPLLALHVKRSTPAEAGEG